MTIKFTIQLLILVKFQNCPAQKNIMALVLVVEVVSEKAKSFQYVFVVLACD
jgi:hypothetical protein